MPGKRQGMLHGLKTLAIGNAIRKANKNLPEGQRVPDWTPYQIRHAAGTATEKTEGLDKAQALRRRLSEEGRAPRILHDSVPMEWYNTSDVRFLTLADFEDFCKRKNIRIHISIPLDTHNHKQVADDPNANADVVIMVLSTG